MAVKNSSVPDLPFTLTGVNKTFLSLLHVCIRIFLFNRCVYSDHSFHSVGLCLSMLIFLFTQSLCIHSALSISTMCVFDHLLPNTIKLSTQKTMKQSVLNYTGMTTFSLTVWSYQWHSFTRLYKIRRDDTTPLLFELHWNDISEAEHFLWLSDHINDIHSHVFTKSDVTTPPLFCLSYTGFSSDSESSNR